MNVDQSATSLYSQQRERERERERESERARELLLTCCPQAVLLLGQVKGVILLSINLRRCDVKVKLILMT